MYSICTVCENGFESEKSKFQAWELPGVTCPDFTIPHLCDYVECKYFLDNEYDYGCKNFILCSRCHKNPVAIRELLENDYPM